MVRQRRQHRPRRTGRTARQQKSGAAARRKSLTSGKATSAPTKKISHGRAAALGRHARATTFYMQSLPGRPQRAHLRQDEEEKKSRAAAAGAASRLS